MLSSFCSGVMLLSVERVVQRISSVGVQKVTGTRYTDQERSDGWKKGLICAMKGG